MPCIGFDSPCTVRQYRDFRWKVGECLDVEETKVRMYGDVEGMRTLVQDYSRIVKYRRLGVIK